MKKDSYKVNVGVYVSNLPELRDWCEKIFAAAQTLKDIIDNPPRLEIDAKEASSDLDVL